MTCHTDESYNNCLSCHDGWYLSNESTTEHQRCLPCKLRWGEFTLRCNQFRPLQCVRRSDHQDSCTNGCHADCKSCIGAAETQCFECDSSHTNDNMSYDGTLGSLDSGSCIPCPADNPYCRFDNQIPTMYALMCYNAQAEAWRCPDSTTACNQLLNTQTCLGNVNDFFTEQSPAIPEYDDKPWICEPGYFVQDTGTTPYCACKPVSDYYSLL